MVIFPKNHFKHNFPAYAAMFTLLGVWEQSGVRSILLCLVENMREVLVGMVGKKKKMHKKVLT